jgi:hypothetical protein
LATDAPIRSEPQEGTRAKIILEPLKAFQND